jgi:1-acyl-sn-glycerol-3-phosphate acyltransferase
MPPILRSVWAWGAITVLILLWLPLLALLRLFDRDPVHYRTGRMFRRLGVAMTLVNPAWRVTVSGFPIPRERTPYVVVSNHQSLADIPFVSHLPWEMKWVGKEELFKIPIIGWMMWLSSDISVNRGDARSGAKTLIRALRVLESRCPVMFFPEGTRSADGRVGKFTDGAFHLALRARVPVLPIVVEGSHDALPKRSWKFGPPRQIQITVLEPVAVEQYGPKDVQGLRDAVRAKILKTLAESRKVDVAAVDALVGSPIPEVRA